MSADAVALVVGTVLAIVALAVVLYPLFVESAPERPPARPPATAEAGDRQRAIDALREIEFDRETGKLSDVDYSELKAAYTQEAIAAMRAEESAAVVAAGVSDPAEAAVLKYRTGRLSCVSCGPRPEANAVYCSACGRYLAGACRGCRAPVTEPGARFCAACGSALAA